MRYADVVKHWKTQTAAAKALGIAQSSVWEWQKGGIPYLRQQQIERIVKGSLKADMRHAPAHERAKFAQVLCPSGRVA